MNIKCVVACRNSGGVPDLFFCEVVCLQHDYEEGEHYDAATELAEEANYDGPFVVFDENDGQPFLFEHFECLAAAGQGNSLEELLNRARETRWTDSTLLMLVCKFIDQKGLGRQLNEHLDGCAAELVEAATAAEEG